MYGRVQYAVSFSYMIDVDGKHETTPACAYLPTSSNGDEMQTLPPDALDHHAPTTKHAHASPLAHASPAELPLMGMSPRLLSTDS